MRVLLLIGLLTLGCSAGTTAPALPDGDLLPIDETGELDAREDDARDDSSADSAARDSAVGDAGSSGDTLLDTPSGFESDPRNCGAAGHDCLGGTCTAGMCAVELVRTRAGVGGLINAFAIKDALLYVAVDQGGGTIVLQRGPLTPGASDTLLFPAPIGRAAVLEIEGDAVYSRFSETLSRFALPGGTRTSLVTSYVADSLVEDGKAYFIRPIASTENGLRVMPATGGTSAPFGTGISGTPFGLTSDGTDLYVSTSTKFYRVPKSTGVAVLIPVTGLPFDPTPYNLRLSSTRLFFEDYHTVGTCIDSSWSLWSAPRAGGAAVKIASGVGWGRETAVTDETYAYWAETPCGGDKSLIRRRRLDGTGPTLNLAVGPRDNASLVVDGPYIYWMDALIGVARTAK